jgi:hypothetical protein
MEKPDYQKLRQQKQFDWFVGFSGNALWALADIPIKDFYTNPTACIEAYRKGRPLLGELFGPDVPLASVSTPMLKYGHLNTLGAKINFPEGGEPHHEFLFDSPQEAIKHLSRLVGVDFATAGLTPFYLDFRRKMQDAFPNERVYFGWQWEGPVTTAWGLLGESFMYDLFDKPDVLRRFMQLATASMVEFCRFFCKVEDTTVLDSEPDHGRLCDDIAAMVPARMWEDFVLPFWDMYYNGPAPDRIVHCEDMVAEQLPYLEKISLVDYDPGISPKLNPKIINSATKVPFGWRLGGFHYSSMTCRDVEDFVYQAVADGASYVFTYIEAVLCQNSDAEKVRAFIAAAKQAKKLLDDGASREEISQRVSPAGRKKFWAHWLG